MQGELSIRVLVLDFQSKLGPQFQNNNKVLVDQSKEF